MENLVFFVSPGGRVLTDESLVKLSLEVAKVKGVEQVKYKCGPSVDDSRMFISFLNSNNLDILDWDLVIVSEDGVKSQLLGDKEKVDLVCEIERMHLLNGERSYLTLGEIVLSIING